MSAPQLLTYRDAVDQAMAYVGHGIGSAAQADIYRAIHGALRELCDAHPWSFLFKHHRIYRYAPETTGTITYDHTGGTYERELTLSGATWPSWAEDAVVRIDGLIHHVEARKSSTVVTLDVNLNPGADVDAGTSFSIWPAYHALPHDFIAMSEPWDESLWRFGTPVDYSQFLSLQRYESHTGDVRHYCIRGIDDLYGAQGLYLHPPTDSDETIDFIYRRAPRQLRYSGMDSSVDTAGTITVTAASTAVTGASTAFDDAMIGSVLRIGRSASNVPTGLDGLYPFAEERVIVDVTSATVATLDANVATTRSGVKYCVSDPIDIDRAAYNAFMRCVEKHLAIGRNMKHKGDALALYEEALRKAKGTDNRVRQRQVAGEVTRYPSRIYDTPIGTDVP